MKLPQYVRDLRDSRVDTSASEPESAVSVRGLSHSFGDHLAVDDVSLEIRPGEVFGLLGPNGAGKTTTIRVITTLLPLQAGSVQVLGMDVTRTKMKVRRSLGYVPQQLSAEAALTGRENVSLFARLFDVPRRDRKRVVDEVIDVVNLTDAADRLVGTYSGGMVRRLELAQALVNRPRLLVLDEPTIGLDPVARSSVWDRIRSLVDSSGMTVLVTTHYMDEADQECDRVALMNAGRINAIGSPDELKAALHPHASLDDVFRHHTGGGLLAAGERLSDVRRSRRTAGRLG
jgi:ABC-2 type transport system ATP-binding protein